MRNFKVLIMSVYTSKLPIAKNTTIYITDIPQIYHKSTTKCDIVLQKCDIVPQNGVVYYKI